MPHVGLKNINTIIIERYRLTSYQSAVPTHLIRLQETGNVHSTPTGSVLQNILRGIGRVSVPWSTADGFVFLENYIVKVEKKKCCKIHLRSHSCLRPLIPSNVYISEVNSVGSRVWERGEGCRAPKIDSWYVVGCHKKERNVWGNLDTVTNIPNLETFYLLCWLWWICFIVVKGFLLSLLFFLLALILWPHYF